KAGIQPHRLFELLSRFLLLTALLQYQAERIVRAGKVCLLLNDSVEVALGAPVVVALDQRQGQIVSCFPRLRVKLQGGLEGGNRAGEHPLLCVESAERAVRAGGGVMGEGLQQLTDLLGSVSLRLALPG